MKVREFLFCLLVLFTWTFAQAATVDTQKSTLTVRVYKTGLFSGFAHDHEISAPIDNGSFSEESLSVDISISATRLKVMDKESSDSEKEKIQTKMLGPEVLDTQQFKEIKFHSTKIETAGAGNWLVTGDLTVHGQSHPVVFQVTKADGHYRGTAEIKQKDFGITPISIAGGGVKVKDAVKIEFDVVGQ